MRRIIALLLIGISLFTSPSFAGLSTEDSVNFKHISTPSNPSSGRDKLYFKSTDKLYRLTSGGLEAEILSGIGSSIYGSDIGSVLFVDSSGNLGQDQTSFFWYDAGNELILGTNAIVPVGGPLQLVPSDGNPYGIYIDGNYDPYTGTDQFPVTIKGLRTIDNLSTAVQEGFVGVGVQSTLVHNDNITGTVVDSVYSVYGVYSNIAGTHTDTCDWQDGGIIYKLYDAQMSSTLNITATGIRHPSSFIGYDLDLSPTITYNNIGGTYSASFIGSRIYSIPTVTLTSGTLNWSNTGLHIAVQGNTNGTSIGYGIYIQAVQAHDTNWTIYSLAAAESYFQGGLNINNTTQGLGQLYQIMNSTTVPGHVIKGITSQSADFLTIKDQSDVEHFSVGTSDIILNDGSKDVDFRVESNGDANNLVSDGGLDRVGIGVASPGSKLDVAGSFQCDSITNDTGLAAGVYTPTRSSETNLDSNVTMTEAQYFRVGNTVTVSGRFTADPTAGGAANFEITLPVSSNIGAAEDAAGTAFCAGIAGQGAAVHGVVANDTAEIAWTAVDTTSQTWSYTFTYQVI